VADVLVESALLELSRGTSGVALAYAAVQGPLWAALWRARASWRHWAVAPLWAAPLTLVAGVAVASVNPLFKAAGMASGTLLQLGLGTAISAGIGYLGGLGLARTRGDATIHQRGTIIDAEGTSLAGAAGRPAAGLSLAGVAVAAADETKHFKMIGTTGTGKTSAIHELLNGALQRGDRAVIADPDGGYMRRYFQAQRGDVVLNPFEAAGAKWDLFGEIDNAYDVEELARSLIPDGGGPDHSWSGYARTFFSAVTRQTHAAGVRDVGELYRLLVSASGEELRTLVRGTAAQPFLEEHNGRMFDSIRSVAGSALAPLAYISAQHAPSLSVRRWVAGTGCAAADREGQPGPVLFLPYRAGQIAALRSTISAWMRLAIFTALDHPEHDQRLWFVIDELDALGQIDGLKDALARLRKVGGRCVLGFQSISQVFGTYGTAEAQTIVENCGNTLVLRCSGSQPGGTAHFASQLIGQREVLRTMRSRTQASTSWFGSATRSEHTGIEPAIMDSEIEQLVDRAGLLKLASDPRWRRVTVAIPPAASPVVLPGARQELSTTEPEPAVAATAAAQVCAEARLAWQRQRAERCRLPPPGPAKRQPRGVQVTQRGVPPTHGAEHE
jgi:hypothetical protein